MDLHVDATDFQRGIITVRQSVPVSYPGTLTLLYPEWLPGYHAPEAPIELAAGLRFRAGERELEWRRDPVSVHAFHVTVPDDCQRVDVCFQLLCPTSSSQGRVGFTRRHLNLQWNTVLLYPAGLMAAQIGVAAGLKLPPGWQSACALKFQQDDEGGICFGPTNLETLIDSPVFAGLHYKRYDIDPRGQVILNVFGDEPEQVPVGEPLELFRNLVVEADALFGARHFDHYDFLVAASDELGAMGVEHHRSAEIVMPGRFFSQWDATSSKNDTIAHEYVHSWNGKFRKGADSYTGSYDQPIQNSLLWVYEGLTQYLGQVVAVRAGLWDGETYRGALARTAAQASLTRGRRWRPLRDTTRDPIISARKDLPWPSWQRTEDYYSDGQLIWLDVDMRLRELSDGTRSLDDFAKLFFGMDEGSYAVRTYDFDELTDALGKLADFDWRSYFQDWLRRTDAPAPLEGLERGGYRLFYRDEPSSFQQKDDKLAGACDLTFSLGLKAKSDGTIHEVLWESASFQAGVTAGMKILSVDGRIYSTQVLKEAVAQSRDEGAIHLLAQKHNHTEQLTIRYQDGHRYPHLAAVGDGPRLLDHVLKAKRPEAG